MWKREHVHWSDTRMELSRSPYVTWYGWDRDTQTTQRRVQTVYHPGSFTPLLRIDSAMADLALLHNHRTLAEKLQQEGSGDGQAVVLPAELVQMLNRLESELRAGKVSEENDRWLTQCGLTVERVARKPHEKTIKFIAI